MFRAIKLPWITWVGLLAALVIGSCSYHEYPHGVTFIPEPLGCSLGQHSFSATYELVLIAVAVLLVLRVPFFAAMYAISQYAYAPEQNVKARLISTFKSSVLSLALLALAALASPVIERFLPLKLPPNCPAVIQNAP